MKVRTKLIIGFTVIVVLMWAIIAHSSLKLSELNRQFSTVEEAIIPATLAMSDVEDTATHVYQYTMKYILYDDTESKEAALSQLSRLQEIETRYFLEDTPTAEELQANQSILGEIADFYFSIAVLMNLKERGAGQDELLDKDRTTSLPALLVLQEEVNKQKARYTEALATVKGAVNDAYQSGIRSIFIAAGIITLLAIAASILVTRSVVRPLITLRKGTEIIAMGNLDHKVGTEVNDEIGELSRAFDKMTQSLSTSMTSIDNLNQEITERKRAEDALRESEEKFSIAFRSSPSAIAITTLEDGVFLEINDSFTRDNGYTREELIGRGSEELNLWVYPEERERIIKILKDKGRVVNEEYSCRSKSGEIHTMLFSAELTNVAGEACILAVTTNITERKRAEEALKINEERFRLIADNSTDLISRIQLTPTVRTDYVSPSCFRITGYKQEEFYNDPNLGLEMIHPEDREFFFKTVNTHKKQRQKPIIARIVRKDGRIIWIEQTHTIFTDERGEPLAVHLIAHEITERKEAEEALRESEERFSKAFHASPDAISISTMKDGTFLEVNDSYTQILGYSREELIGSNANALNMWPNSEQQETMLRKINDRVSMHNEELEFLSKSGEIHTMLFSNEYIQIGGEPCMLVVSTDITERKKIEETLKEREKRFSDIAENTLEWIWEVDASGKYIYSSPVVEQILGYKPEELLERHFFDFFLPEERRELKKAAFEAFAQKQPIKDFVNRNMRKDGKTVYLMTNGVPVIDEEGNLLGYRGVDTDITESRQAEEALKESERKLSIAFNSSPNSMSITTLKDGIFLEVNDGFTRDNGYTREEVIGRSSNELGIWVNPKDRDKIKKQLRDKGRVMNEEYLARRKSGETLTMLFSAELINIADEPCVLAVTSDISGRKRAEKLQLDENHVLTLMGQGVELSELLDAIVRLGESHDPAVKGSVMLYDSSKELLFQAAGPSLPDSYLKLLENGVAIGPNMGSCGTAAHLRERVVIPDISNTPLFPVKEVSDQIISNGLLACWSQPIIASNGELLGTIANYSTKKGEPNPADIRVLEWSASIAAIAIERKRAEEALSNEAIRRRILIEQSREGIVVLDQNGNVYESNQRFAEMLGYSLEEVYKLQVWDWEFQFTPEQVLNMIQSVDETGDHFETRHKRKDGTIYDVEISTNGAVFAGEKLIFCVCRDITERKRAEEALRLSDAAFRSIHESVIVTDLDGIVTHWNEISEQMFGIKATDAIGKRFLEVIEVVENYPGETPDRIKNIQTQGYWQEERLYRTPKGDIWVDVHLQDIVDNDKRYGRVMLATDITQRKQAEVELKQALAKLEESSARLAATNQELEAFSYSVSHDLRSPLRSIDGFSQALLEDYNDKLDDNGQDFLKRLRGASQKMGELIDGLLKLSRLTRSEMHEETVDMSALAEEIAARLQETPEGRRAKFTIDKSLSARGDPQLLRVLLENLLNNAWKFTRQKPLAKIEFGAVQNNGKKTYFVKDNGAGFDIAYSDKLFSAFQRLHDSTDFPGTGIGLATVKRIINRHGGTIRAEGEVGKGATFYFTLD